MKTNSTASLGALHPILFFLVVYGISLFLALFVCRTIYFGINEDTAAQKTQTELRASNLSSAVAYK